eukprot:5961760-Pyramimonas_sp.AAC.1
MLARRPTCHLLHALSALFHRRTRQSAQAQLRTMGPRCWRATAHQRHAGRATPHQRVTLEEAQSCCADSDWATRAA